MRSIDEMSFEELVDTRAELDRADELGLEEVMARARIDRRLMSLLDRDAPADERRATLRVPGSPRVRLLRRGRSIDATVIDLGEGGLRVSVSGALDETFDELEVELVEDAAGHQPAHARARVSWRTDGAGSVALGLQFVSEPPGHRRRMRHLVLELLRRLRPPA